MSNLPTVFGNATSVVMGEKSADTADTAEARSTMASNGSGKHEGKGAAEEPEPDPPSSTASYDPTVFQRPHPDDRGGAHGSKPRKKGDGADNSKAKAKTKSKDGKDKGALSLERCGWCDTEGANKTCMQCRSVVYCSPACQKVSRA